MKTSILLVVLHFLTSNAHVDPTSRINGSPGGVDTTKTAEPRVLPHPSCLQCTLIGATPPNVLIHQIQQPPPNQNQQLQVMPEVQAKAPPPNPRNPRDRFVTNYAEGPRFWNNPRVGPMPMLPNPMLPMYGGYPMAPAPLPMQKHIIMPKKYNQGLPGYLGKALIPPGGLLDPGGLIGVRRKRSTADKKPSFSNNTRSIPKKEHSRKKREEEEEPPPPTTTTEIPVPTTVEPTTTPKNEQQEVKEVHAVARSSKKKPPEPSQADNLDALIDYLQKLKHDYEEINRFTHDKLTVMPYAEEVKDDEEYEDDEEYTDQDMFRLPTGRRRVNRNKKRGGRRMLGAVRNAGELPVALVDVPTGYVYELKPDQVYGRMKRSPLVPTPIVPPPGHRQMIRNKEKFPHPSWFSPTPRDR